MNEVDIFTDGACRHNPGPGGWGVILKSESATKELYGGEIHTTNNQMELLAAIKALQSLNARVELTFIPTLSMSSRVLPSGSSSGKATDLEMPKKNRC